jgi:hypothetical protein
MCDSLATDVRYTSKFVYLYEPDQYFLWTEYDHDHDLIAREMSLTTIAPRRLRVAEFLRGRCAAWLD